MNHKCLNLFLTPSGEEDSFVCDNGVCIFGDYECDAETDCIDGSDEHDGCGGKVKGHENLMRSKVM